MDVNPTCDKCHTPYFIGEKIVLFNLGQVVPGKDDIRAACEKCIGSMAGPIAEILMKFLHAFAVWCPVNYELSPAERVRVDEATAMVLKRSREIAKALGLKTREMHRDGAAFMPFSQEPANA